MKQVSKRMSAIVCGVVMSTTGIAAQSQCSCGAVPDTVNPDFVTALDQSHNYNLGTHTDGPLTTTGLTEFIGGATISPNGVHGGNIAGVRFGVGSGTSDENNNGTNAAPDIHLAHYEFITYTFDQTVYFQDNLILKDLDGQSAGTGSYIDAAAVWYEDESGNIVPATATTVGSSLISFDVNVATQPSGVSLPAGTGYATPNFSGSGNSNQNYWVEYNVSTVGIRKIYIAFWNNDNGNTHGTNGISFASPLRAEACNCSTSSSSSSISSSSSSSTSSSTSSQSGGGSGSGGGNTNGSGGATAVPFSFPAKVLTALLLLFGASRLLTARKA